MNREPIILRSVKREDAACVLAAFLSHEDMSRQGKVETLEDAYQYIAHLSDRSNGHEVWAITGDDEKLVGVVAVSVDEDNRSGWFWYWMHREARGRGWMKRAAVKVANWALKERGLERLELGHRVNNPASGAVAQAAGFVREGTERGKFLIEGQRIDVATYGRLCSDPWPEDDPCTTFAASVSIPGGRSLVRR